MSLDHTLSLYQSKMLGRIVLVVTVLTSGICLPAHADWFGDYFPLTSGTTWTFQNLEFPYGIYAESVLDYIQYEGHDAVRMGEDFDNYVVAYNDGQLITVYAEVDEGVVHDFVDDTTLGQFSDGAIMQVCPAAPCDSSLVRMWDALDPEMREVYDVDPALTDLIVIASYDPEYNTNLNNLVIESNLPAGVTVPSGAITGVDWYQKHVGQVIERGVDAATGNLLEYYVLIEHEVAVDDRQALAPAVLHPIHPNPFNPRATISYTMARAGSVTIQIYDCAGRLVTTLVDGASLAEGRHTTQWDGRDAAGRPQASGTFICRLRIGTTIQSRRLTLLR